MTEEQLLALEIFIVAIMNDEDKIQHDDCTWRARDRARDLVRERFSGH